MAIYIQKITETGGQYRVTIPKNLLKIAGLEEARVVEITKLGKSGIKIEEYNAKKRRKTRAAGHTAKTN